jgi:sugar lactone lactonase YvrE
MKNSFKILALLATLSTALAAPSEINYQGVLTDQQGNPVNGVRAMQIKLYDAPTGGNMTYQENIGNVTVADGIYNFKFGASGNGIASALNGNDHLALIVDSVEQPARTKILAVPYALKASESADVQELRELLTGRGFLPNYQTKTIVTTFAGSETAGTADGVGTAASFSYLGGIAVDAAGNVYVSDSGNHKIRKITPTGVVTTLVGGGGSGYNGSGSADGTGTAANFNTPGGVAVDSIGNIYVADSGNHKIRKITPAGVVTTLAGSGAAGSANGTGASASFRSPSSVAVDASGNVYVADIGNNKIRIISPAGVVTTFQQGVGSNDSEDMDVQYPAGIAVGASGNVYIASSNNHRIIGLGNNAMNLGDGYQDVQQGPGRFLDSRSSSGVAGSLNYPSGVAVDSSGNVYVADTGNFAIRKGSNDPYRLFTLAGCGISGSQDGVGSQAMFSDPRAVAVDSSGNVYVADGRKIRKIKIIGN